MRKVTSVALLVMALPLGGQPSLHAAGSNSASPSAIVFAGPPLPKPVILRGMDLNAALLGQLSPGRVVPSDTLHRRHLRIAMFYARSSAWATHPDSIGWTHADLSGRYYPRQAGQPALLLLGPGSLLYGAPRWMGGTVLTDSAMVILAAHGIPTR